MKAIVVAAAVGVLVLGLQLEPVQAQLGTITFPDTAVGSTATVKCPTLAASVCFGASCNASGTVQSVSGPSTPFSIGKFAVLSNSEFFGGNCEAHPASLPVTLGPGQILAYQATFAPTSTGTFNGTLTFSTTGGPATFNLTGKGTSSTTSSQGLGLVTITGVPERAVPGNRVEISYAIARESLTGPVDLYAAIVPPGGQMLFLDDTGGLTPSFTPLRRNLPPTDTAGTLLQTFPVDVPFGTYTFLMALIQAGKPPAVETLASPIATATGTFAPLSVVQQAVLDQRGNPDGYAMFWIDQIHQKREVWIYLSPQPVEMVFLNGGLDSTTALSSPPPGGARKVDPALLNPQTSRARIVAEFGGPTGTFTLEDFETLSFPGGIEVVFSRGRLTSVSTGAP